MPPPAPVISTRCIPFLLCIRILCRAAGHATRSGTAFNRLAVHSSVVKRVVSGWHPCDLTRRYWSKTEPDPEYPCTLIEQPAYSLHGCDTEQPNERPRNDPSQGSTAINAENAA